MVAGKEHVALVVEDEKPLAQAIRVKLEQKGFDVVEARTAEQAIDYLDALERIDVIWLDHYLIGSGSGIDVLVHTKSAASKFRDVPVFIVSNTATADKVAKYIELGADKYFVKSETKLQTIIDRVTEAVS